MLVEITEDTSMINPETGKLLKAGDQLKLDGEQLETALEAGHVKKVKEKK